MNKGVKDNRVYAKLFKRLLDFVLSLIAIAVLSPILLILMITGTIAMRGNPFFVQPRPGKKDKNGQERIFKLIKFRSMDNRKDSDGKLFPDHVRLNKYGRILRLTSLDELPELFNILVGNMSIVGPRPQLVRDMTFMTSEQRRRHDVRPGLTGLAQINGRNNITWEQKFEYDLHYIDNGITPMSDIKIIFRTIGKVCKHSDAVRENMSCNMDFGDWLLKQGKISQEEYEEKQQEARVLLGEVVLEETVLM